MRADIKAFLADRVVQCSVRKLPAHLTRFFFERLRDYGDISAHPDADVDPRRAILGRLFAMLKVLGQPVECWRKDDLVKSDWGALQADIKSVL